MANALSTLYGIQVERWLATPAKLADNPLRATLLTAIQSRNATLDTLFYDVKTVRPDEHGQLSLWLAREGAVLVVPPTEADKALTLYLDVEDFLATDAGAVGAIAVAGVGSSALGAAAFARNVADAIDAPVAAVVSGYGLADVLTEGLGGWLWFGGLNAQRHWFEGLDRATKFFSWSEPMTAAIGPTGWVRASRDTETVLAILRDPRCTADLLIGHSKGNLVISEALYALCEQDEAAMARRANDRIVTVSAKVGMPPAFHRILDIIGEQDSFGRLNSRPDIPADYVVPHAWHSTNPDFMGDWGLDVTAALQTVLPDFDDWLQRSDGALASVADAPQRFAARLAVA
jgi:hypothetical protein